MILDRIIKGFWGRYFFYLSVFVAIYFLMREKLDGLIYGLGDGWFKEGEHPYIAIFIIVFLWFYPMYRSLKDDRMQIVDAAHIAYIFIPISAWYLIQVFFASSETSYWMIGDVFLVILSFTLFYSYILIVLWLERRPSPDKNKELILLKDEPIKDDVKDELGFTLYAKTISEKIHHIIGNQQPFVFGIEGGWGSGKTSFINLVKANLEKDPAIRILDYNPWMSSSVQQMTTDFFSLLAENTPEMRLRMKFREYGKALAAADGTGIVGKVVESICPSQNLGTILETINECIVRQDLHFVVFIDDTDRLDREELLAVFKLVRNTASFSNTVFVITYDRGYVETVLSKYFEDDHIAQAYPDKIVNFQFELPNSAKDYYEILKKEISKIAKIDPENKLKDDDLPKKIIALFDSYRKVKRVFNALAVESDLPHFTKIPIKDTLVFFYMAFYQKEDYEMVKEAYISYNSRYDASSQDNSSQIILRLFEEANSITKPKDNILYGSDSNLTEEIKKEKDTYLDFKNLHKCVYELFESNASPSFIKYLDFLFKFNAIHYKEYKERYDTYGIDGYKGINLILSDAENILDRLTIISKEFPKSFYQGCSDELIRLFINEDKEAVIEEDLQKYYQFLFGIILNSDNYAYFFDFIINKIEEHFRNNGWNGQEILSTLNLIDDIHQTDSNTYTRYYSIFSYDKRYNLTSGLYQGILRNLIKSLKTLPYKSNDILEEAGKHLQRSINNKLDYDTIEFAFYACYKSIDPQTDIVTLSPEAYSIFRGYIEESPDDFIYYCIRSNGAIDDFKVTLHPFLLKIFEDDKMCIEQYFKDAEVKIQKERNKKICSIIRKYINEYLSDKTQKIERKLFQISDEDFDYVFEKKGNNAERRK